MKTYPTEELAQRRAEALKLMGIWPGIVKLAWGGGYRLTYDPGDAAERVTYR